MDSFYDDMTYQEKVKVSAHQANYFRTLPLHASQKEIETTDDYSIFTLDVIPNFHLKKELISYMDSVEVLEPKEFRDEMKTTIKKLAETYEQ